MDAGIFGSGNIGATAAPCLEFCAYLSRLGRSDERTRTADLISLPVCSRAFLSIAGDCECRIYGRFLVLVAARYCRSLRPARRGRDHLVQRNLRSDSSIL
jgi:hypothetical protein